MEVLQFLELSEGKFQECKSCDIDQDFVVFGNERKRKEKDLPEDEVKKCKTRPAFLQRKNTNPFTAIQLMKLTKAKWTKKVDAGYRDIRDSLFDAVNMKDAAALETVKKCRDAFAGLGIKLHEKKACHLETGKSILHEAIEKRKWILAHELANHEQDGDFDLFRKTFPVKYKGVDSEKSCLFMLIEKHGRLKKQFNKDAILQFTDNMLLKMSLWSKKSKENQAAFRRLLHEPSGFPSKSARTSDLSPLHVTSYYGDMKMARLLLSFAPVDADVTTRLGESALMWAMLGPEPYLIGSLLLDHNASVEVEACDGSMAIHWAVRANNIPVILKILQRCNTLEMVNKMKKSGFPTPLIQASACGFSDVTSCLLKSGADIRDSNHGGQTAVHYAAAAGNIGALKVLLQHPGEDGNIGVDHKDKIGSTALMFAVCGGHVAAVQLLIAESADIYNENQLGETPWSYAMERTCTDVLAELVEAHNARLSSTDLSVRISPLQVAVRRNALDKLQFLLEKLDRAEVDVKHRNTFIHVAAAENQTALLKQVLLLEDPLIHAKNCNQDTPLHLATKQGHIETVEVLLASAGNGPDSGGQRNMAKRTPLHESVCACSPEMTRLFLSSAASPQGHSSGGGDPDDSSDDDEAENGHLTNMVDGVDEQGNTCLHLVVARSDGLHLVKELIQLSQKINMQNFEGNTALHLASISGNVEAVEELISVQNINLRIRNSAGRTALHEAVKIKHYSKSLAIVNMMVTAILKAVPDVLTYKDQDGDTALHVACKHDKVEIVKALVSRGHSPKVINCKGNNPLHVANFRNAASLREALTCFKGLNLNQENFDGETVLEVHARCGLHEHVAELVLSGADLGHLNKRHETLLHSLVRLSVLEVTEYKDVYQAVVNNAVSWWCLQHDMQIPSDTATYNKLKTYAVLYLTAGLKDEEGLSVLNLAVYMGAKEMVQTILHTPGVFHNNYTVDGCKLTRYNITGLTPASTDTLVRVAERWQHQQGEDNMAAGATKGAAEKDITCLDILAEMSDVTTAVDMMKLPPIRETVDHYWRAFQWLTLHLMVIHVVYMSVFSMTVYPAIRPSYHGNSTGAWMTHDYTFSLFLPWPFIALLVRIGYDSWDLPFKRRQRYLPALSRTVKYRKPASDIVHKIKGLVVRLYDYMPLVASLILPVMMSVWYVAHVLRLHFEVYIATVALLIGWLLSISFTLGIKGVHTFSEMLRYIMVRDIARFLCIYLFVLCAFLFPLHVLFQVVPELSARFNSAWDTLFLLFNLMVGVGDLFDSAVDEQFLAAGYSPIYPKILYITYVILSMIIMVNLLIAMVNETYESVKSREGTTWRRSTVVFAVRIERDFPFLRAFFRSRLVRSLADYCAPETLSVTLKSNAGNLRTLTWTHYVMDVQKDSRAQEGWIDEEQNHEKTSLLRIMGTVDGLEKRTDENRKCLQQVAQDMRVLKDMVATIWLDRSLAGAGGAGGGAGRGEGREAELGRLFSESQQSVNPDLSLSGMHKL